VTGSTEILGEPEAAQINLDSSGSKSPRLVADREYFGIEAEALRGGKVPGGVVHGDGARTLLGVAVFRGDLQDVLDRFYQAARPVSPRYVVRLTGDCPLLDFRLIDGVIRALQASGAAYASNVDPASFPDGLDVECLTFAALERAWREARTASQREHVTPYIRQNTQLFPAVNVTAIADLSALRWTVDYPDDLQLVQELLRQAGARTPADCDRFDFYRVIESNPRLLGANRHPRNEGYAKSLRLERDSPEKS